MAWLKDKGKRIHHGERILTSITQRLLFLRVSTKLLYHFTATCSLCRFLKFKVNKILAKVRKPSFLLRWQEKMPRLIGWHSAITSYDIWWSHHRIGKVVDSECNVATVAGLAQSVERLTAEREVAVSIPWAGQTLRVFKKMTEKWRLCLCPANS